MEIASKQNWQDAASWESPEVLSLPHASPSCPADSPLLSPYFSTRFEPPLLWKGLSCYCTPLCWTPQGAEWGTHCEHPESIGKVFFCCSTAWSFKTEPLSAAELKQSFGGFLWCKFLYWVESAGWVGAELSFPTFANCSHFMAFEPRLSS